MTIFIDFHGRVTDGPTVWLQDRRWIYYSCGDGAKKRKEGSSLRIHASKNHFFHLLVTLGCSKDPAVLGEGKSWKSSKGERAEKTKFWPRQLLMRKRSKGHRVRPSWTGKISIAFNEQNSPMSSSSSSPSLQPYETLFDEFNEYTKRHVQPCRTVPYIPALVDS